MAHEEKRSGCASALSSVTDPDMVVAMKPNIPKPERGRGRLILLMIVVLAAVIALVWRGKRVSSEDNFIEAMQQGKNYFERGSPDRAIEMFEQAVALDPTHADAHLNLANAYLLAGQSERALAAAEEVLKRDPDSAAAHFVKGSAHIRLGQFEQAAQSLQTSTNLDPTVGAAFFQLGIAHQQLKQNEEAITAFQAAVARVQVRHKWCSHRMDRIYSSARIESYGRRIG